MARPKNRIDEKEIDEIIDLYIKHELNGIVSKLSNNGVCNFNKKIANNLNYIRENGDTFKLHKYQVWGGQYRGEDGIGKVKIKERKVNNEIKVIGSDFSPATIDIIQLVNDLHSKPEKLIIRLCRIFERKEKLIEEYEKIDNKNKKKIENLQQKLEMMDKAFTNLIFQSQSPGNSLNNMFNMCKKEDYVCFNELVNMFNEDNERITTLLEMTKNNQDEYEGKLLNMNSKLNKGKYSRL